MSKVTTYNPKKVTCSLGKHIVSGYSEDSFITIEPSGDGTTHVSGADGEIVRSISTADIFTFKLKLLQSSDTNAYLQKMYDNDSADGSGMFSVCVNDILGNEKFVGAYAWVTKPASFTRGKSAADREWEITVADGEFK